MIEVRFGRPGKKERRRRPASDPNGFIVLTQYPFGGFHAQWCISDSGAELSRRNSNYGGTEAHVIPVSDLLAWRKSGLDELEAMVKLCQT